MSSTPDDAVTMTDAQLAARIHELLDELSARETHEAFSHILEVVAYAGTRVGESARSLAASRSWSEVGQVSGTSKQAAWQRWRD